MMLLLIRLLRHVKCWAALARNEFLVVAIERVDTTSAKWKKFNSTRKQADKPHGQYLEKPSVDFEELHPALTLGED